MDPERKDYFGYRRSDKDGTFFVEMNLSKKAIARPRPVEGELLLATYGDTADELRPFEANVYKL